MTEYVTNYKWTVDRFTTRASLDGPNILISEDFKMQETNARGYFALCHSTPFSGNGISLFLCIEKVRNYAVKNPPIFYFSISNKDGERLGEQKELKGYYGIFNSINYNGFKNMCLKSDLYPPSPFLRDDTLVVECQLRFKYGEVPPGEMLQVRTKSIPLSRVHKGCLVYSGQKQFYVAGYRLSSSSAYFKTLMESNDENMKAGIIQLETISDFAFSELKRLILFGYSFETLSFDWTRNFYALADKYKFDRLKRLVKKDFCAPRLKTN